MPVDRRLLDVLCCPATGVPVHRLDRDELKRVNAAITAGKVRNVGDELVLDPLQEALVTDNGERIYPIEDGIPIMLEEKAILAKTLDEA